MIRRFINWLKGSHQKRSDDILKQFSQANTDLQQLNQEIAKQQLQNIEKIEKLQSKNTALSATFEKNSKVAANIARLLGEE